MTAPYWTTHTVSCLPGCEGDWECGGCECHPIEHRWGCTSRCDDDTCVCVCHAPTLFEDNDDH